MSKRIIITELECWHANQIIYQATGRTDDGGHVYVRYRRPWFSVGVGGTDEDAVGADTIVTDAHPDHDPTTISIETLRAWTQGAEPEIIWPDRIRGYNGHG